MCGPSGPPSGSASVRSSCRSSCGRPYRARVASVRAMAPPPWPVSRLPAGYYSVRPHETSGTGSEAFVKQRRRAISGHDASHHEIGTRMIENATLQLTQKSGPWFIRRQRSRSDQCAGCDQHLADRVSVRPNPPSRRQCRCNTRSFTSCQRRTHHSGGSICTRIRPDDAAGIEKVVQGCRLQRGQGNMIEAASTDMLISWLSRV